MARIPGYDVSTFELGPMPTPEPWQDPYGAIYEEMSSESMDAFDIEPLSPAVEEALVTVRVINRLPNIEAEIRHLQRQRAGLLALAAKSPAPEALEAQIEKAVEARNISDIIATIGRLGLSDVDYFVIGGANMVLRGIKPTTPDLDILVSDSAFNALRMMEGAQIKSPPPSAVQRGATNTTVWIKNDTLDIPVSATDRLGDGYYPMGFDSHRFYTELIEDIPCLRLEDVIDAKAGLQRRKDLADLKLIEAHLGTTIHLPARAVGVDPMFAS